MTNYYTLNYWLALTVFIAHIVVNFIVAKPNPELLAMLQKYTFSPPFWVFGIWFVIWGLQGILFYKTFNTQFWSSSITAFFILVCLGNVGSQIAGSNNLPGVLYVTCLIAMLAGSIFLMEQAAPFYPNLPVSKSATQLYVGWASLAFVVGLGAVLVAEQEVISNRNYSTIGYLLLTIVPIIIWSLWFKSKADYRVVSIPYFLLYFAFSLRLILK